MYADGTWHHYVPGPTGRGGDFTRHALPDPGDFTGIFAHATGFHPFFTLTPGEAARRSVKPNNWTSHYVHYKNPFLPHPREKQTQLCVIWCINIPSPNKYTGLCEKSSHRILLSVVANDCPLSNYILTGNKKNKLLSERNISKC